MICVFALFRHACIGFPHVVLKWVVEDNQVTAAYFTVAGVIVADWRWHNPNPLPFIVFELQRFDTFVRDNYGNRPDLQG